FTEHQRTMFCVFSGVGVNKLRDYLNSDDPASIYETEGTMYDDREAEEGEADQQVTGMMNATGLGVDDDDMNDDDEAGEGSQYGVEADASSDKTPLFAMLSSPSHSSRPTMPPRASTTPNPSSTAEKSSPSMKSSLEQQQTLSDDASLSLASVYNQWIQGLEQYKDFHLHAALSTFKRLLRNLRTTEDDISSPTTSVHSHTDSTLHRTLLPEEVALLYTNIALIHGYLGSYYLATAAFEEALLLNDMLGLAWFGLGVSRFYLRELSASRRAFGKCLDCFVFRAEDGRKYQKEELVYKTCAGQSTPSIERDSEEDVEDLDDASSPWKEFKGILGRSFPGGVWKLEKPRVEWNWRIALFERNYLRKGVERPGGGRWGLNGIPAGVIFGPNSLTGRETTTIHDSAVDKTTTEATELGLTTPRGFAAGLKGRSGTLVKEKWSHLQQKLSRKKVGSSTPPRRIGRTQSAASMAFSGDTKDDSIAPRMSVTDTTKASPGWLPRPRAGILKKSMPLTPALTLSQIRNPFTNQLEEVDVHYQTASRTKPMLVPMPSLFPPRRSSLTLQSTKPPLRQRRSSRGSLLVASGTVGGIGKIEEEPDEVQEIADPLNQGRPASSMSSDISPKSFAPTKWTDDILLPSLMSDLAPSPAVAPTDVSTTAAGSLYEFESSMTEAVPPLSLQTSLDMNTVLTPAPMMFHNPTSGSQYGHDSFMTDNISPLSSQMRSAMFPRFSDQYSGSSRRPSWASGDWNANPDTANSSRHVDRSSRQPSAIVTLTPATPEKGSEHRPATATIINDLIDGYDLGSSSDPSYSPYPSDLEAYLNDNDMAVAPLNIKKERMSITGRTCLGEWEWEEQYERWKQEGSVGTDDEDDAMVGEMLLPRRYEG
ncbi:MAG: hypothetical protein Q9184_007718, partial [Pyrenodesmia sp. 2 TL-2023]